MKKFCVLADQLQTFPIIIIEQVLMKVDVMLANSRPTSPRSLNKSSLAMTR